MILKLKFYFNGIIKLAHPQADEAGQWYPGRKMWPIFPKFILQLRKTPEEHPPGNESGPIGCEATSIVILFTAIVHINETVEEQYAMILWSYNYNNFARLTKFGHQINTVSKEFLVSDSNK